MADAQPGANDDLKRPSIQLLPQDTLKGVVGAEDVVIDQETGVAYISSDDRYATFHEQPVQGAIYALDLKAEQPLPRLLTDEFHKPLHPHGISLYVSPAGERRLFVINHRSEGHYVEIFSVKDGALKHLSSHQSETFRSPNAVYGVGLKQFYVSNDKHATSKFGRFWEYFFKLKRSRVAYCDGNDCRFVAKHIAFGNGITGNADNSELYVVSTLGGRLHHFNRNTETGALSRINRHKVGPGLDNLRPLPDGRLLCVAHPKLMKFIRHAQEPKNRSPWNVYLINPNSPSGIHSEEIFHTDGAKVSGGSVCAVWKENFIIGTVFENALIIGTLINNAR